MVPLHSVEVALIPWTNAVATKSYEDLFLAKCLDIQTPYVPTQGRAASPWSLNTTKPYLLTSQPKSSPNDAKKEKSNRASRRLRNKLKPPEQGGFFFLCHHSQL